MAKCDICQDETMVEVVGILRICEGCIDYTREMIYPPRVDKSYHLQDGCHNCDGCLVVIEHDSANSYFCKNGAKPPPQSGGFTIGEDGRYDGNLADKRMKEWDRWSKGREVFPCGKCYKWEKW